ncbi:MAG: hypothetical protein JO287_25795 [Pseudonocardiales bacterium]|nr:hypothetical protein [Pseudonocardiales bacterium]
MHQSHEARQDTVVFPTLRAITPGKTFAQLGERFAELDDPQFGNRGCTDAVNQVAQTVRSVGIEDLANCTP